DDILAKVDRASMMCSLETRAVFLDNDLVEFCRRLPARFKYRSGERKYLLKKAVAPLLPRGIMRRPKKGFGIPAASWLRCFPERVPTAAIGGVDGASIERAWHAHRAGKADHRMLLWCWLSLVGSVAGRDAWKMAA